MKSRFAHSSNVRTILLAGFLLATIGCGQSEGGESETSPTGSRIAKTKSASPTPIVQDKVSEDLLDTIDSLKSHYIAVRLDAIKRLGEWKVQPGSVEARKVLQALYDIRAEEYNDFEDPTVNRAIQSLGDVTVAEIDSLIASNDDKKIYIAVELMRALGGDFIHQLSPMIRKLMDSDDSANRWQAFYALEGLGPSGIKFFDDIVKQAGSSDFQDQQVALRVLSVIGPKAVKALPMVRELADEGQNISVRSHAMIAMGNLAVGSEEAEAVAKQLLGYLNETNFVVKERAMTGLIAMGPDAAVAADKAKELMEKDKTGLAAKASYLYGVTTDDWQQASSKLGLLSRDLTVGFEAVEFLKLAGANGKAATELLLTLTRSQDQSMAAPAVEALSKIYAKPPADDKDFKKVVQRLKEVSGESSEAGYIALKQMEAWEKANAIEHENKQHDEAIDQ